MQPVPLALVISILLLISGCNNQSEQKALLPSKVYHYSRIDTSMLINKHSVYAPVYSHLYGEDGNRAIGMTAMLSIRNISFTDSFYVTNIVYFGSQGETLKNYLDSTLVVRPMHSIEFVVERMESKGGAGANFIVDWASVAPIINEPLIQTVISTTSTGVSFVTNGIEIKSAE